MDSTSNIPITYHAKWTIRQRNAILGREESLDFMGTLYYYGNRDSELELYMEPPITCESISGHCETIVGVDAYNRHFLLYAPKHVFDTDFRKIVFTVRYFMVSGSGMPAESLNDKSYDICVVDYPFLRNWAYKNILNRNWDGALQINRENGLSFEVEIAHGIKLKLISDIEWCGRKDIDSIYEYKVEQKTSVLFRTDDMKSPQDFLSLISEFSRFFSIATFFKQSPSAISFKRSSSKYPWLSDEFYFPIKESAHPFGSVISFDEIVAKKPDVLRKWHDSYEQMSPISKYLENAVTDNNDEFDTPDFLIVAQALDGYFKRFVNGQDGKNTQQYEHQIIKLLKHFEGVLLLQECQLDAAIMAQSRHKYSHLLPDNDSKRVERAVKGTELYYLTQKGIVLLTCCILDNLGLTIADINSCFRNSVIEDMVSEISFHNETQKTNGD